MKTPLTDAKMYYPPGTAVVPVRFAQELERDLRHLLLRLYMAWEDDPLSFGPESAGVMEKWEPEIKKMLKPEPSKEGAVSENKINAIRQKCKEEIAWAEAELKEMAAGHEYANDDRVYLPCWLKAHKEILDIIENQVINPKEGTGGIE